MRALWMAAAALALLGSCGGGGSGNPFSDDACPDGSEGCRCYQNSCFEGLVCLSDICVDPGSSETGASGDGDSQGTGDGDGTTTGDGDGTTTGDGDGDGTTTGDGDGTTTGDGDGTTTGDGDGTTTGDGDGTTTGDGDGTTTGDGDGTTSTSGDGDGTTGTTGDGDGTTGGGMGLGELERCVADMDCETGLVCRDMVRNGQRRCVSACVSNAQCPLHTRCIDDGTGQTRCLGEDVGRSCAVANDCMSACLVNQGYCTDFCSSGADCPNGYGCMGVGTPAQNVCVKFEALCDASNTAECIAPSACDLGPNMILGGCTGTCNTALDCPQRAAGLNPWSCDGLCRRPADVYGPLEGGWTPTEWHCDALLQPVNLCNDAQHVDFQNFTIPAPPAVDCGSSLTTTGPAGDSCANSCLRQGGCAHDFACTAVGSVAGGRIGLCLPTGTTETGQACSTNTQCEFGYCSGGFCSRDCTFDDVCTGGTSCVTVGAPNVEGFPFKRCE